MEIKEIREKAKDYGVPIIRTESQEILRQKVIELKPKHILEIGTAVGFSGIIMLKNSEADLYTMEHNNEYIIEAKKNFKSHCLDSRVQIYEGDCLVGLANMVASKKYDEYFDLIFLDGPKAQYDKMLELLIILLKPNGTLIVDNVLFRGYVNNTNKPVSRRYKTIIQRLNNFIENCKNHQKLTEFILNSTEDGMIFVKKVNYEK